MSQHDFILDNLKYSFSSVNSFENCQYGFYLTYIDANERTNNFFGEFGTLCHSVLEEYFFNRLEQEELEKYFTEQYCIQVVSAPPAFLPNAKEDYFQKGLNYFRNFEFDKSIYNVIIVEEAIDIIMPDFKFVVKPDLILQEKKSGKYILVDFKTANILKNGKPDKVKIKNYLNQFNLYAWGLWNGRQIEISEIQIWFIINNIIETILINNDDIMNTLDWFRNNIQNIKNEEDFVANNKNSFFCNQLCSVSQFCKFKP